MREANGVAQQALDEARDLWRDSGVAEMFGSLVDTVWRKNLERHEPDELGDNAKTLGSLCAENLANRVQRCIAGHDLEVETWSVENLTCSRPKGALRLTLAGKHFYVMKAPPSHALTPQWDSLVNWDSESNTRQALAEATRMALGGYTTAGSGQSGLWQFMVETTPGQVRHFMVVWAGELASPRTAGWITLPIPGVVPFAGVRPLWQATGGSAPGKPSDRKSPDGPGFDDKPPVGPTLTLKRRTGVGQP